MTLNFWSSYMHLPSAGMQVYTTTPHLVSGEDGTVLASQAVFPLRDELSPLFDSRTSLEVVLLDQR